MTFSRWKIKWLVVFVSVCACVDKIDFDIPASAQSLLVVEGMINDGPGPYVVKVSAGLSILPDTSYNNPVQKASITLYDDEGNTELFTETTPGVYVTGGTIQGKVGHAYHIVVVTQDGKIFKSAPETINPVGEIEKINFSYEARTLHINEQAETAADVFNVSVNAKAASGDQNYVRFRFTGTYKVVTRPQYHVIIFNTPPPNIIPDPYPCSGWTADPDLGPLQQISECTCCICWVTQFEEMPTVDNGQLVVNGEYRGVKVGEVPINGTTFTEKYLVQVEQMSLTKVSFEFFNLIRSLKSNASSLFQALPGQIRGNMTAENSSQTVVGLFWATSINTKYLYIQPSDVPYIVHPGGITEPCTSYANSTTTQPVFWN